MFGHNAVTAELARGLEDARARAVTVGPDAEIACQFDTIEGGTAALARAHDILGGIDALVWAWADPDTASPMAIGEMSPERWAALAEDPLHRILLFFKLGHAALRERGGAAILLLPSLAMTGAAGMVPWGTAAEGQRSIAKAVARKWGALRITVNSLAVPATLFVPAAADLTLDRPGLPSLSLSAPTLRADVAPLIASLVTPAWRAVTGVTIGADGGRWMTP